MFGPRVFLFALTVVTASATAALAQGETKDQQACLDRRADQPAELDYRIAACLRVIGDSTLGADIRSEAHLRRALAYAHKAQQSNSRDDIDRAIADLSEGLRLDPDNAAARRYVHQMRAGLHFHKGDLDSALADYTELIRLQPNSAVVYEYRAVAYATKGDHARAIADYTEAIRLEPKVARLYNQRAWSLLQVGNAAEALSDSERAVALDANDAGFYGTRALAYRALGKTGESVTDLRKAVALDPSNEGFREELRMAETPPGDAKKKGADGKELDQVKAELRKAQEAAKAAEQRLAALEAGGQAPAAAPDSATLAKDLQNELRRVGCDAGAADGKWGKKAQSALQKFASHTKVTLSVEEPTPAALDAVLARKGRVCPLECDDDEREVKGKCVPKQREAKKSRSAEQQQTAAKRSRAQESSTSARPSGGSSTGGFGTLSIGGGKIGIGF